MLGLISPLIRPGLVRAISPRIKPFLRPVLQGIAKRVYPRQAEQHDANIAFVERLYDDLSSLAQYPDTFKAVLGAAGLWNRQYFHHDITTRKPPCFVTNTPEDIAIAFRPERDIDYASILTHITGIAARLADSPYREELRDGIRVINAGHTLARQLFEGVPTCMARYTNHDRIALSWVQRYDPPTNCTPSLHVTDMALLYTLLVSWDVERYCPDLLDEIRHAAIDMVACVLEVKQHTIDQVAISLEAADMMCRRFRLPTGLLRRDLASPSFGMYYPHIPIRMILETHDRFIAQREPCHKPPDLVEMVLRHYETSDAPLTPHGVFDVYAKQGRAVPYDPSAQL